MKGFISGLLLGRESNFFVFVVGLNLGRFSDNEKSEATLKRPQSRDEPVCFIMERT